MKNLTNLNKFRIGPAAGYPVNFQLEVTRACNLSCRHCRRTVSRVGGGESIKPAILEKVEPLLAQADMIGLSGWGESLASPMVWPSIEAATRNRINPCLTSNGTLLNERNCQRLIESGLGQVTVSLDAGTPDGYRRMRPGAELDDVIAGILRLGNLRDKMGSITPFIAITFNFRESSAADFPDFIRLAAVLPILKAAVHPHYPPEVDHENQEWRLSPQARAYYEEGLALARELGVTLEIRLETILDRQLGRYNPDSAEQHYLPTREQVKELQLFPTCRCAWDFPFIDLDGNVFACSIYPEPFGNLREGSFAEVWNNERFTRFRRDLVSWHPSDFCLRCHKTMWYSNHADEEIPEHLPLGAEGLVGLGWHAPEKKGQAQFRWSRGEATVHIRNTGKPQLYFVAWALAETRIAITVNGRGLGSLTILPVWDVYTIKLPPDEEEILRVSFSCLDPRDDPASQQPGCRLRLLGIAVGQIGTCETPGDVEPRRILGKINGRRVMGGAHVVTGAFGYSGKYIAARLLERGDWVRTLTNSPGRADPFGGRVKAFPFNFNNPDALTESLRGAAVLYNTYWVRFNAKNFSHAEAVRNTLTLFECARRRRGAHCPRQHHQPGREFAPGILQRQGPAGGSPRRPGGFVRHPAADGPLRRGRYFNQ